MISRKRKRRDEAPHLTARSGLGVLETTFTGTSDGSSRRIHRGPLEYGTAQRPAEVAIFAQKMSSCLIGRSQFNPTNTPA